MTIEITEEEYQEELSQGLTDEETLKPGTYKVRRSPWAKKMGGKKLKISIYLDSEVVEYFRQRAEDPNTAPYQTQINNELRKIMENDSDEKSKVEDKLLENESFLRALKEKLETV
jgi:uncharacterized protein (DUF4415 family)